MDNETHYLAAESSSVLVQEMAQGREGPFQKGVIELLGQGTQDEFVRENVEVSRAELVADEGLTEEAVAEWRVKFRRHLRKHPEGVSALRALLDEVAPARNAGATSNTVSGDVSGVVIQAGTIHGAISFGSDSDRDNASTRWGR